MHIVYILGKFRDEISDLLEVMEKDIEVSADDFYNMLRILDKVCDLAMHFFLWHDVTDIENVMETEKDRFEIQKFSMKCKKEIDEKLEKIIKMGRTWKFKDYRCIDVIKRLTEFTVEAKEAFSNMNE